MPERPLRAASLVVAGLGVVALATHVPEQPPPPSPPMRARSALPTRPTRVDAGPPTSIDLNRADAEALTWLPGIGPALAARILEDRARRGPYDRIETLARVRGIGPRTIERLRPFVTIDRRGSPREGSP